jgi:hypothetical protein
MSMSLLDFHEGWAWFVIFGNGAAGLWCLAALSLPRLSGRWLWLFVTLAQVGLVAQVVIGVFLVSADDRDAVEFHMFYGFIAVIAIGIIYSYRHQMMHRIHLLYGLGSFFVMGLAIRAMFIGTA